MSNSPTTEPISVDEIADAYGIQTEMAKRALRLGLANLQTFDRKQRDYGSGNISKFGEFGVLVRATDKFSRLTNLLTNVREPSNEAIEDTWLDLSNYALIAVMCRRGDWR